MPTEFMSTELTPLDESMFRAMLEYINDLTPRAQEQLRQILSTSATTFDVNAVRRRFVPSSVSHPIAEWDGHESEDL